MRLQDKIKYGYTYVVYPADINSTPLKVAFMEKMDKDGEPTGTYYSFAELSAELGEAFVPVPHINENFLLIKLPLGFGEDSKGDSDYKELDKAFKKLLKSDMRAGLKKEQDIDLTDLDLASYGFFAAHEIQAVPKNVTVEETI